MKSVSELTREIQSERAAAQWSKDVASNEAVIKGHISRGTRNKFVMYGGGDPEAMARLLSSSGLVNVYVDGSMVWGQLP